MAWDLVLPSAKLYISHVTRPPTSMARAVAIHVVFAKWCPHCVSVIDAMRKVGEELNIPCVLYDIDTPAVEKADELVRAHGDWKPDYLIPQIFIEFDDGTYMHVLTGDPRGVAYTQKLMDSFLQSNLYSALRAKAKASPASI